MTPKMNEGQGPVPGQQPEGLSDDQPPFHARPPGDDMTKDHDQAVLLSAAALLLAVGACLKAVIGRAQYLRSRQRRTSAFNSASRGT